MAGAVKDQTEQQHDDKPRDQRMDQQFTPGFGLFLGGTAPFDIYIAGQLDLGPDLGPRFVDK